MLFQDNVLGSQQNNFALLGARLAHFDWFLQRDLPLLEVNGLEMGLGWMLRNVYYINIVYVNIYFEMCYQSKMIKLLSQ